MAPSKVLDTWFVASSIDSLLDLQGKLNKDCADYSSAIVSLQLNENQTSAQKDIQDKQVKLINELVESINKTKILADFASKGLGFLDSFYTNGNFTSSNQERLNNYLPTEKSLLIQG